MNDTPAAERAARKAKRQANRERMLARLPRGGRCAEIGVWNGDFTASILEITAPRELVLIDPWDLLADASPDTWVHAKNKKHDAMREMFDHVTARFADRDEVVIRKGFSEGVLAEYPDDHFDWVYIDGNHLYDFVRRDLALSFDKVRPGGIIAGDDFGWQREGRKHVREAVRDELEARGMEFPPEIQGQQFLITVP